MNMREKMVDAMFDALPGVLHLEDAARLVDAVLDSMMEPTPGMTRDGAVALTTDPEGTFDLDADPSQAPDAADIAFNAMIRAVKEGK